MNNHSYNGSEIVAYSLKKGSLTNTPIISFTINRTNGKKTLLINGQPVRYIVLADESSVMFDMPDEQDGTIITGNNNTVFSKVRDTKISIWPNVTQVHTGDGDNIAGNTTTIHFK